MRSALNMPRLLLSLMTQRAKILAHFDPIGMFESNTRAVPLVLRENAHKGRVFFCPSFWNRMKGVVA